MEGGKWGVFCEGGGGFTVYAGVYTLQAVLRIREFITGRIFFDPGFRIQKIWGEGNHKFNNIVIFFIF